MEYNEKTRVLKASPGFIIAIDDFLIGEEVILGKGRRPEEFKEVIKELSLEERIQQLEEVVIDKLSEKELKERVNLFEDFEDLEDGYEFEKDKVIRYKEKLYKVLATHKKQADWLPDVAVSLFVNISAPAVIDKWKQPLGAHDAYKKGDKVLYQGKVWINTVDNNVYQPGVYGWTKEVK